jgi:hypothetical protein
MRSLLWYFWIAPHALLVVALVAFLRRGLKKQLPLFFGYMVFQLVYFLAAVIANVVVIFEHTHPLNGYRWILVWGLGISALISFGVIYELVSQTILYRSTLARTLRPVFRSSVAVLVLLTAIASARLAVSGIDQVMKIFQVLDFSSGVLQVGLLLVLLLFSRVLRISWRSLPVGIAVGLGINGCVELSVAGLLSVFGPHRYPVLDVVRLAAFHVCVLIWLGYILFPEREVRFTGAPLQKSELESWDQEMQRMMQP